MVVDFCILLQVMYARIYFYSYIAYYFTCCICMHAAGSMLRALEVSLHEVYLPTFLLIRVILFCSLKILLLSAPPPQHIKPYVEIKCQLDATEVFIADLIACSTCFGHHYVLHQGYVSGVQDAAASCKPSAPHQTSNMKSTARNTTGSNHSIVLLSS